jgi:hypothetical protein
MSLPTGSNRGQALNDAMTAIEIEFTPLVGVLPKEFSIFEPKVLEDLLRIFDGKALRAATGDVFGRIYEFFLMKFAIQGAHDNGEFFTPPSIVQTIVNVIAGAWGRLQPGVRLGRHVCPIQPLHREAWAGHIEAGHLLRPGENGHHHQARQNEPRSSAWKAPSSRPTPSTTRMPT